MLKQVEALFKNQQESKLNQVANSIQMKLLQKQNKIDTQKEKIIELQQAVDVFQTEKCCWIEEKQKLETNLKNSLLKNETLENEYNILQLSYNKLLNQIKSNDDRELSEKVCSI